MSDESPDQSAVIFVGGCDRSGTTIVSRLIAEQLGLIMLPEAYFHAVAFRRFGADVSALVALRHWRRRSWGLSVDDDRRDMRLAPYLRECMSDIQESRRGRRTPLRTVESTPENIEIGSTLLSEFADATLVHVVRDPRAVAASLRAADFGPTTVQECARFWKQRVASGLALETSQPDRVARVRYESFLADPTDLPGPLAGVAPSRDFTFEPERDAILDPTSRQLQTQALAAVDTSRIDGWRSILTPEEVGMIEYECRELMVAFGYELEGSPDARTSTQRLLTSTRSALGELTTGSFRRLVRVARARVRHR